MGGQGSAACDHLIWCVCWGWEGEVAIYWFDSILDPLQTCNYGWSLGLLEARVLLHGLFMAEQTAKRFVGHFWLEWMAARLGRHAGPSLNAPRTKTCHQCSSHASWAAARAALRWAAGGQCKAHGEREAAAAPAHLPGAGGAPVRGKEASCWPPIAPAGRAPLAHATPACRPASQQRALPPAGWLMHA
jgi:hypothetical protein